MRTRRVKRITLMFLVILLIGYGAGRLHQRDLTIACVSLSQSLDQLVTMYEAANTTMWESLGIMIRQEELDR